MANGDLSGAGREIIKLAKDAGVVVQQVDRVRLDAIYPHHQGMLAFVSAAKYAAFAIAGSNYDVKAGENLFVDAWIHAVVREGNAPVVDAGIKSALKNVSYL